MREMRDRLSFGEEPEMAKFEVGDRVRYVGPDPYPWREGEGTVVISDDSYGDWVTVQWDKWEGYESDGDDLDGHSTLACDLALVVGEPVVGEDAFAARVNEITSGIAKTLIEKNQSYGNAALDPIRVFSGADRTEQLYVRIDDKLSRIKRGSEYPGDDTIRDLIGYLFLLLIARESE